MTSRVVFIVGTRPEAIKQAPAIVASSAHPLIEPLVVSTGQHEEMVAAALAGFGISVDRQLELDRSYGASQPKLLAQLLPAIETVLVEDGADAVVVQGDTASAVAGATAGSLCRVPVVHLEAGLRSHDNDNPFPEELYRRTIGALTALHLTPTDIATENLLAESVRRDAIVCTGNTVVDAALAVAERREDPGPILDGIAAAGRRLVLVTVHRRENWGAPLASLLAAVQDIVHEVPDIEVVLPVHPNPIVHDRVWADLGGRDRIHLVAPLDHGGFITHLQRATLALSDSGGVQEEAPTFGVPALVLRDTTERPEAILAGSARLVGTDRQRVAKEAIILLTDESARQQMATVSSPFGDGHAGARAVRAIAWHLGLGERPEELGSIASPTTPPPAHHPFAPTGDRP